MDRSELEDREEAKGLIIRYGSSLDERDWDRLATCFVADVTSVLAGGPQLTGYEELEQAVRGALGHYRATHHHIAGVEVDLEGDTGRLRANLIATHLHDGPLMVVGGVYREALVRTADGWRISHHQLDALWLEGG